MILPNPAFSNVLPHVSLIRNPLSSHLPGILSGGYSEQVGDDGPRADHGYVDAGSQLLSPQTLKVSLPMFLSSVNNYEEILLKWDNEVRLG